MKTTVAGAEAAHGVVGGGVATVVVDGGAAVEFDADPGGAVGVAWMGTVAVISSGGPTIRLGVTVCVLCRDRLISSLKEAETS